MQSINVSLPNGPSTFSPDAERDTGLPKEENEVERVQTQNTPGTKREMETRNMKNAATPVKKQMNFQKVHN